MLESIYHMTLQLLRNRTWREIVKVLPVRKQCFLHV